MQEAGNDLLLVEPGARREIQHVDAVELVVLALVDQRAIASATAGIGGLSQRRENWAWMSLMLKPR